MLYHTCFCISGSQRVYTWYHTCFCISGSQRVYMLYHTCFFISGSQRVYMLYHTCFCISGSQGVYMLSYLFLYFRFSGGLHVIILVSLVQVLSITYWLRSCLEYNVMTSLVEHELKQEREIPPYRFNNLFHLINVSCLGQSRVFHKNNNTQTVKLSI